MRIQDIKFQISDIMDFNGTLQKVPKEQRSLKKDIHIHDCSYGASKEVGNSVESSGKERGNPGRSREIAGKSRELDGKNREIPGNRGRFREIPGAKRNKSEE